MLPKSLRWRLPLSYAAIALLAALSLGAVLMLTLGDYYADQERRYLEAQARVVGTSIQALQEENVSVDELRQNFPLLALLTQTRVQLLDQDGNVLADSGLPHPQELRFAYYDEEAGEFATEPYHAFPADEVPVVAGTFIDAGTAGVLHVFERDGNTISIRMNDAAPGNALHIAPLPNSDLSQPIPYEGARSSQAVRTAVLDRENRPLYDLLVSQGPAFTQAILRNVFTGWLIASAFAIVLAAGTGWIISRRISAPLVALTSVTGRMAQGELSARAQVIGQDEVGFLARSFNDMASRVEDTVLTLRRFIGDAAHEIHTPLTALNTNLELAATETDEAARLTFLKRAQEQLRRMETLTTNLLNLSRLETGTVREMPQTLDVVEMVQVTSELYASQAEQAGISFRFEMPPKPLFVTAHAGQLRCALENLLENALKFTPENGTITVGIRQENRHVILWVQDTGIGIPPEDLPHVFSRFHRARNAAAYPGSGLGLAILKAIAEQHHGQVQVRSKLGQGTVFAMQLPA